ncbi:hypothetical protein [Frigidibacter sp. MR17.24]|uniref:hypothetical protein n=1 Tax=Frigidibacter sp. MR17.24 TaxID=3127345 RepID=UPI003012BB88
MATTCPWDAGPIGRPRPFDRQTFDHHLPPEDQIRWHGGWIMPALVLGAAMWLVMLAQFVLH